MTIATFAIGEMPVAAQPAVPKTGKPPRHRLITAKADRVQSPEPR